MLHKLIEKLPTNIDEITIKQAKEIKKLEYEVINAAEIERDKIDKTKKALQQKIANLVKECEMLDTEISSINKIVSDFNGRVHEIRSVFEGEKVVPKHMTMADKIMKGIPVINEKHYADVYGIRFLSPIIKHFKESTMYPGVPCTLRTPGDKIFIIYFPTLGQYSAVREPNSLFVKKTKAYTVSHKAIDNNHCLMDKNHNFAYVPFTTSQWKIVEKDIGYFHNFDIYRVDGAIREYGHPFVFNDVRTITKTAQTASNADISFCFDLHAQIYFMMYLCARTSISENFPIKPK